MVANPKVSFVILIYVVPLPVDVTFPFWSTCAILVFKLLYVFAPAGTVSVNRLNPLLTLTLTFLVSPMFGPNNKYFWSTSSLGLLIHSTVNLLTVESLPSSPFPLYPVVQTVPSYLTKVVWYPLEDTNMTSSKFPPVAPANTCFGTF